MNVIVGLIFYPDTKTFFTSAIRLLPFLIIYIFTGVELNFFQGLFLYIRNLTVWYKRPGFGLSQLSTRLSCQIHSFLAFDLKSEMFDHSFNSNT